MNLGIPQVLMLLIFVFAVGMASPDKKSDQQKAEFGMTVIVVVVQILLMIWGGFFTSCD